MKRVSRSLKGTRREPSDRLVDQQLVDGGDLDEAQQARVEQTGGLPVGQQDVAVELQRLDLAGDHRHRAQAVPRGAGRPGENEGRALLRGVKIREGKPDEGDLAGSHRRSYSASRGSSHSLNDDS